MSIGNLKDSGNLGNNFPWQLKMLQGLQGIYDEVKKPLTCLEDSVALCAPVGGFNVNLHDGAGTPITSTPDGLGNTGIDVNIINALPLEVNITEANDSILVYGNDGTTNRKIKTDANGELQVDILSLPNPGYVRIPGALRPTNTSGDVNTVADTFFSVSVANVGASNGTILAGVTIKPGEVLNFSADAVNNYFTTFPYDATGTEFVIIYVTD
jgi:hypothetical protein